MIKYFDRYEASKDNEAANICIILGKGRCIEKSKDRFGKVTIMLLVYMILAAEGFTEPVNTN
jgi:hypothetical protein